MKFFVSRQKYWPDGTPVVEVAVGGLDYANADMLVARFKSLGECEEFTDPIEAVEAAIRVCDAWKAYSETSAQVAVGSTGGMSIPFEPGSYEYAREWAEKVADKLPRCSGCGDVIGEETYRADDWSGDLFCSDTCAQKEIDYQDDQARDDPDTDV